MKPRRRQKPPQNVLLADVTAVDTGARTITVQLESDPTVTHTATAVFDSYPAVGSRVVLLMNDDDAIVLAQLGLRNPLLEAPSFTENFNGPDSTVIGPQLIWRKMGNYTDSGAVEHFGDVAGEVFDNTFTVNRNASGDTTAQCWARAEVDVGSPNMRVSATIAAAAAPGVVSGTESTQQFSVQARCGSGIPANFVQTFDGTLACWQFDVATIDTGAQLPSLNVCGSGVGGAGVVPGLYAAGDRVSIEVTGQRGATRVVCKVNDTVILALSATEDAGSGTLDAALAGAGLTYDDLPTGQRGALMILAAQQDAVGGYDTQREDRFDDFRIESISA